MSATFWLLSYIANRMTAETSQSARTTISNEGRRRPPETGGSALDVRVSLFGISNVAGIELNSAGANKMKTLEEALLHPDPARVSVEKSPRPPRRSARPAPALRCG